MVLLKYKHCVLTILLLFTGYDFVTCQCDAATRPWNITASEIPQYLSSPNYPEDYEHYADCAWRIRSAAGERIIINIEFVDVEGISSPCKYDFLQVYDGEDETATELAKVCWANRDDYNEFVSTTDVFYLTFTTDYAVAYDGYNILIFTNNSDTQPDCTGDTPLIATDTTQYIMSPNLPDPYSANLTCLITFMPATLFFAVRFEMIFLDVESSSGCTNDFVRIYGVGDGGGATEYYAGCSRAVTYDFSGSFPLDSTGVYTLLNFTTGDDSNNYLGFMMSYTEVFKGINLTYPNHGDSFGLEFPEDTGAGSLNTSVFVIELTYTGTLDIQLEPLYSLFGDQNASLVDNVQIFAFTETLIGGLTYVYLDLAGSFDYEIIDKYSVIVRLSDNDVTQITYTVTYNITLTDVDDVSPVFTNLPNDTTIHRGRKTGYSFYTVDAYDGDGTENNSKILYALFSDGTFDIDNTTGDIMLAVDATTIPLLVNQYVLTVYAYSAATYPTLQTQSTYTVNISPDSPPVCSHDSVDGDLLDVNLHGAGYEIPILETWNCSDDNVNISYSITTVTPVLVEPFFDIDNATGTLTLLRSFIITEVPSRQFFVEMTVTDSVGQVATLNVYINVTALTCFPNPRRLSVRMDQEIGGVVMDDFNCTRQYGLTYIPKQYPAGTFEVREDLNGSSKIYLMKPVLKINFYSMSVVITDGVDITNMVFNVVVQTKRCGISSAGNTLEQFSFCLPALISLVYSVSLLLFC